MRVWMPLLALFMVGLAGCVEETPDPADDERTIGLVEAVLSAAPDMDFDAEAAIQWWEHISTAYPKHDSFTPANDDLREYLISELEAIGMAVEVRTYHTLPRDPSMVPTPEQEATEIQAVIATKHGSNYVAHGGVDHRIGLVSHYDTQAATVHGAYDDKSGTAAQFHICKALMQVPMNKTLSCIFFDAEEQGLVASKRYVEDIADETEQYVYDFVLGYDMTGINWPGHDWKMYVMTGGPDHVPVLKPLAEKVLYEHMAYPIEGVEVLDVHDRNSDEMNFKRAGIPIYRFAGGRHASDYDQYHMPLDTVDHVYEVTDGRDNFKAGFTTIVEGSYHLILVADQTDVAALQHTKL